MPEPGAVSQEVAPVQKRGLPEIVADIEQAKRERVLANTMAERDAAEQRRRDFDDEYRVAIGGKPFNRPFAPPSPSPPPAPATEAPRVGGKKKGKPRPPATSVTLRGLMAKLTNNGANKLEINPEDQGDLQRFLDSIGADTSIVGKVDMRNSWRKFIRVRKGDEAGNMFGGARARHISSVTEQLYEWGLISSPDLDDAQLFDELSQSTYTGGKLKHRDAYQEPDPYSNDKDMADWAQSEIDGWEKAGETVSHDDYVTAQKTAARYPPPDLPYNLDDLPDGAEVTIYGKQFTVETDPDTEKVLLRDHVNVEVRPGQEIKLDGEPSLPEGGEDAPDFGPPDVFAARQDTVPDKPKVTLAGQPSMFKPQMGDIEPNRGKTETRPLGPGEREIPGTPPEKPTPTPPKRVRKAQERRAAAKKQGPSPRTFGINQEDIEALADYAIIGAWHVEQGARSFAAWSKRMLDAAIDDLSPEKLRQIWDKIRADRADLKLDAAPIPTEPAKPATGRAVEPVAPRKGDGPTIGRGAGEESPEGLYSIRTVDLKRDIREMTGEFVDGPERQSMISQIDAAEAANLPDAEIDALVARVEDENDVLTAREEGDLLYAGVKARNRMEAADAVIKDPKASAEDKANAAVAHEIAFNSLYRYQHALIKAGTNIARALAIRRFTVNKAMDAVSVITRARMVRGEPLTKEAEAKLKKMAEEFAEVEKKRAEWEKRALEAEAAAEVEKARAEAAEARAKKPKREKPDPTRTPGTKEADATRTPGKRYTTETASVLSELREFAKVCGR